MNIRPVRVATLTMLICVSAFRVQAVDTDELIRASIIEKIARFIEWPEWEGERFNLCVVEKTGLLPALQNYYETVLLANKPVSLLTFRSLAPPRNCQAFFLGEENMDDLPMIMQLIDNKPVLVVAEKKAAVEQGTHVDFFTEDNRLHLEVNRKSLESSGFKVSYHLLKVARIVE